LLKNLQQNVKNCKWFKALKFIRDKQCLIGFHDKYKQLVCSYDGGRNIKKSLSSFWK